MDYFVSPVCLTCMFFGLWGNRESGFNPHKHRVHVTPQSKDAHVDQIQDLLALR